MDQREKRYVGVTCLTSADGIVTPRTIDFDDDRCFEIQLVSECRRAHSFKVGGTGIAEIADAYRFGAPEITRFGNDILLEYEVI